MPLAAGGVTVPGALPPGAVVAGITVTVVVTVLLAGYSSRIARTTGDFYVAARSVPAWWNASAISGEYLSAASFLGVAGLILAGGADAVWFPVGYAVGYVLLLALVAAPLRRSGAYTLPDFCEARLRSGSVRLAASVLVVVIGWLYVVPQLRGAGLALNTVLGTPVWVGGLLVSVVVLVVIVGGGMRSVTLVQGFQYWLKLVAILLPVLFLLAAWRVDGAPSALADQAPQFRTETAVRISADVTVAVGDPVPVQAAGVVDGGVVDGPLVLAAGEHTIEAGTTLTFPQGAPVPHVTGTPVTTGTQWAQPLQGGQEHPLYRTYALMFALFLGTMGLPHVLVRFYTNPDGRQARRTALIVIGLVGLFYLAPSVYGMLGRLYVPELLMTGQADAVVLLLPRALLGGAVGHALTALICAGAAAAFLATATGLTVTVAGVLSQDVVGRLVRDPIRSFRWAAVAAVIVPLVLGLLAASLPLAQAVALAFTVAASTFCPLLLLGIWWQRLTDVGAASGLAVGGTLALGAITLSVALPGLTGWPAALLSQPAAWAMPAALATMVVVSRATAHRVDPGVARIMIRLHTPESTRLDPRWSARGSR
jgi:Na+(H+)/acetate symporter ActP